MAAWRKKTKPHILLHMDAKLLLHAEVTHYEVLAYMDLSARALMTSTSANPVYYTSCKAKGRKIKDLSRWY